MALGFLLGPFTVLKACAEPDLVGIARKAYDQSDAAYRAQGTNAMPAWKFARACFDLADFATKNARRAELAQQGITAAEKALALDPKSAPGHYYLGMNYGQLARTKTLGALRLVGKIEREFKAALELDEHFDYAGPDRNLGMLYRDAPSIGSVGNKARAREHLERAVKLAPDYPENRLALLEGYVAWGNWPEARKQLKELEALWPSAQKTFAGDEWASSWVDWDKRLAACKKTLIHKNELDEPHDK